MAPVGGVGHQPDRMWLQRWHQNGDHLDAGELAAGRALGKSGTTSGTAAPVTTATASNPPRQPRGLLALLDHDAGERRPRGGCPEAVQAYDNREFAKSAYPGDSTWKAETLAAHREAQNTAKEVIAYDAIQGSTGAGTKPIRTTSPASPSQRAVPADLEVRLRGERR